MGEIYDCDGLLVLNCELNSLVCQNYNTGDKYKGRTMGLNEPRERVEISSSFDQHPGDYDQDQSSIVRSNPAEAVHHANESCCWERVGPRQRQKINHPQFTKNVQDRGMKHSKQCCNDSWVFVVCHAGSCDVMMTCHEVMS